MNRFWPHLRKFLVFQFKLYVDAFRDILLSALSLVAFLLDAALQLSGPDSFFDKVLAFGRRTEESINLFNQYDDVAGKRNLDSILDDVEKKAEETIRKHKP